MLKRYNSLETVHAFGQVGHSYFGVDTMGKKFLKFLHCIVLHTILHNCWTSGKIYCGTVIDALLFLLTVG